MDVGVSVYQKCRQSYRLANTRLLHTQVQNKTYFNCRLHNPDNKRIQQSMLVNEEKLCVLVDCP